MRQLTRKEMRAYNARVVRQLRWFGLVIKRFDQRGVAPEDRDIYRLTVAVFDALHGLSTRSHSESSDGMGKENNRSEG